MFWNEYETMQNIAWIVMGMFSATWIIVTLIKKR